MDAVECIKTRMSIRKFKPEPVPKKVLLNIIDAAKRSPSYKNTQPWEVAIVSGAKKSSLRKAKKPLPTYRSLYHGLRIWK